MVLKDTQRQNFVFVKLLRARPASVVLFARKMEMFHVEPELATSLHDMSDEDIRAFAELQEDPASDAQIESSIYTNFLIFTRTASMEHLERAIQRGEGWVAATPDGHPQRVRRSEILDTMSARLCEHRQMLEDPSLLNLTRGR